jgi:hypothetical protein
MGAKKIFTLSDKRKITANELAVIVGISRESARRRLNKSNDVAVVLAPISNSKQKLYTLSDGSTVTAQQVASILNIDVSAAHQRLKKSDCITTLYASALELKQRGCMEYVLDDGTKGNIRHLSELSGLSYAVLRNRLKYSTSKAVVFKPICTKSSLYTLADGSQWSVLDYANETHVSCSHATTMLKMLAVKREPCHKVYSLEDNEFITVNDVVKATGISAVAARKRINKFSNLQSILKLTIEKVTDPILLPLQLPQTKRSGSYRMSQCEYTGDTIIS